MNFLVVYTSFRITSFSSTSSFSQHTGLLRFAQNWWSLIKIPAKLHAMYTNSLVCQTEILVLPCFLFYLFFSHKNCFYAPPPVHLFSTTCRQVLPTYISNLYSDCIIVLCEQRGKFFVFLENWGHRPTLRDLNFPSLLLIFPEYIFRLRPSSRLAHAFTGSHSWPFSHRRSPRFKSISF